MATKNMTTPKREQGRIWFKLRGAIVAPLYLIALFYPNGLVQRSWLTYFIGNITFLSGVFIRIWSEMHIHYRLKGHKVLALTGPYSFVRNPLYIGNTLLLTAIPILTGLMWFVPVTIAGCLSNYSLSVKYEEPHLIKKYGEPYVQYLKNTPRWIPKLKNQTQEARADASEYILPSIKAEIHTLLLLVPIIIMQLWRRK
jgi:protein-S-isoprenylcysteine O-methyltransferase Ste14